MAQFIDEFKSPAVGAYFDTGNAPPDRSDCRALRVYLESDR